MINRPKLQSKTNLPYAVKHACSPIEKLAGLQLKCLDHRGEAGLWITSLPWPRASDQPLSLGGQPTYCKPMGRWPREEADVPRRLLLIADGEDSAPEFINLASPGTSSGKTPAVEMECFARSSEHAPLWENHLARIRWGDKSLGIAMGLRTEGEVHWWEACNLVIMNDCEHCCEVEMGGTIPLNDGTVELMKESPGYTNPFLHKHNWLNGYLYLRLHSNGVCEVFAHHINSKFYDDGLDLKKAIAVIGIQTDIQSDDVKGIVGPWDGSRAEFSVNGVRFDMSQAVRLASPEHPGCITADSGFLIWQPYQGVEVFLGETARELTGDAYLCHAEDKIIPRGVARTVQFSFSLSDRSPRIAHYLAPDWWYGLCEEFSSSSLVPEENDQYQNEIEEVCLRIRENIRTGTFEDGGLPWFLPGKNDSHPMQGLNAGCKGDLPYALLMTAWRTGNGIDYRNALRMAYHFTDIAIDHAMKAVRMQGFLPPAVSPTLGRIQAPTAAYFEVGDPYLLRTAKSVLETTFWTHMNSWPRMAVGRDACFISGALLLYRYCGDDHYRQMAREAVMTVVRTQRSNGSFGDQGGGAGIHGVGAYVTKAWMGLLATSGLIDYHELFPDEQELLGTILKFGDWLLETRLQHDGGMGWTYQHDYAGQREDTSEDFFAPPTSWAWHHESLGRTLGYCTLWSGDVRYIDAYYESRGLQVRDIVDYSVYAQLFCLAWIQDHGLFQHRAM